MDLKSSEEGNLNISEQLNKRIPIEKWSLLQPNQNDFNFGKKGRKVNDRILNWVRPPQKQFPRKEYGNQQMKRRTREITIPRPIKYRKHLLPFQRTSRVRVNVSCFNLPKSLFSGAMLGITPQKLPNDDDKTIASTFFPQITSTPLSRNKFFTNPEPFTSSKSSSLQSYAEFLSSIQAPLNEGVEKLFPNSIADNILIRLRAAQKPQIPATQSEQELIKTEAADVLLQKRAKITFLRKEKTRKLQNSYSAFNLMVEDDQQSNSKLLEHAGTFPLKEPTSPDFTLSPFWFQQAAITPVPNSKLSLAVDNQLNEDWEQNLDINEVLPNLKKAFKTPSCYGDQLFNLGWENKTFSPLVKKKSNCEAFGAKNPFIQNPDCGIFNSTQLGSPQKVLSRLEHDDDVISQLISTEKNSSKQNMKRRDLQPVLDETNRGWKRSLLDESLQTNSSEIIRTIDILIKQSPNVKPKNFNIYNKSQWE